jgi:hypothetical protein
MANWRTKPYTTELFCMVAEPKIVFQARVNQSEVTYPLADFTYDSADPAYDYNDIRPGMTLHLGTTQGAADLGKQRVRQAFTADTAYVGWSSIGNHPGELTITDDAYITVYEWYEVWSKIPLIASNGTMFKDYNIPLGTYGVQTPPVANGGPGIAKKPDPITNKLRVNFDAGNSFATVGGSLTYLWELPSSGATLITGLPTSQQIAVDFDPCVKQQHYYVYLTVTDTNGKFHTCSIPVYVGSGLELFSITTHNIDISGQSLTITIKEELAQRKYPPGTLVMVWEEEYYNSENVSLYGPTGREHMRFIGWFNQTNESLKGTKKNIQKTLAIPCLDIVGRLKSLPGFPQLLQRKNSPSDWTQIQSLNIDLYVHYILYWHSTALELADFVWSGVGSTTYPLKTLGSDGNNIYAQAQGRSWAIRYNLTCDTFGRLAMKPDPILQDVSNRTSVVQQTLTNVDYKNMRLKTIKHPRTHWLRGASIVASVNKVLTAFCIAPGVAPGQGDRSVDTNEQLVASQEELNIREGHNYARQNNELQEISFELMQAGYGGIEPAYMEWLNISLTEKTRRNLKLVSERFLPKKVNISYSNTKEGITKKVTVTCEPEVIGEPAVTQIIKKNRFDISIPKYTPLIKFPKFNWGGIDTSLKWGFAAKPSSSGTVYAYLGQGWPGVGGITKLVVIETDDFWTPSSQGGPTWRLTNSTSFAEIGIAPGPRDISIDPFSPLFIGTGDQVNALVTLRDDLFHLADLHGSIPTALSVVTFPFMMSGRSSGYSPTVQDYAIACHFYGSGVLSLNRFEFWTTDDGFASEVSSMLDFDITGTYHVPSGVPSFHGSNMYVAGMFNPTVSTLNETLKQTGIASGFYPTNDFPITAATNNPKDHIVIPFSSANDLKTNYHVSGGNFYYTNSDGVITQITFPANQAISADGSRYEETPKRNKTIGVSLFDPTEVVFVADDIPVSVPADLGNYVYASQSAGAEYRLIEPDYDMEQIRVVQMSTSTPGIFALLGTPYSITKPVTEKKRINVSTDFGRTIDNHDGNLEDFFAVLGVTSVLGISGG